MLQHHTNATRDGVYTDATMTQSFAKGLKLDTTFNPTITGNVYAQPLYVPNGPGGKEAFIVATEENHVLAIDSTGKTIWEHPSSSTDTTNYGTPVTNVGSVLGCGDIDPLGITGTPVVDATARVIYFDAMTGPTPTHKIYAISLDDGTVKSGGWPVVVDTAVSGFVSQTANERGALALVNGVVYAAYGGHNGDCNNPAYHGWVVGVPVGAPNMAKGFSTGSLGTGTSTQGGIWASGGIASDGTSLFVATGNTDQPGTWSGGEAVLKLASGPTYTDSNVNEFHVSDWLTDDQTDADLGGANPVLFDMPGSGGATAHLVAAFGKDGYLYLLNRDNLGGAAGFLSKTAIAAQGTTFTGSLKASSAAYTTSQGTYLAYRINTGTGTGCPAGQTGNLGVAKITFTGSTPTPTVIWCAPAGQNGLGSPMVTTTGGTTPQVIVWDANTHLFGYDGDTGTLVFDGTSTPMAVTMHKFNTPIGATGRMLVATAQENNPSATSGRLYIFR